MLSEVIDLETLSNLFTYTGYCRQTKEYHQFVIWQDQNDYESLIEHLYRDKLILIGYNIDNFDYPIIHHMLNHYNEYRYLNGRELAQKIYDKAQSIIDNRFNTVADWNKKMIVIDLFKIHHYDNMAKLTSLKSLQIAMDLPLVEDMPFSHEHWIRSQEEVEEVLHYNKNDVFATNEFLEITMGNTSLPFYKGKNKIELRQVISKQYKMNCLNYNDIKLGTELILKLYCERTGKNPRNVRKYRTPRSLINLEDCLPVWTHFKTKQFKGLVDKFKNTNIYDGVTKKVLSYSLIYNGVRIDYGTGGAHAANKSGIYESNDKYIIVDLDISSMYPNLAIKQNIAIEHLGKDFIEVYDKDIVSVRMKEKLKPKEKRSYIIMEGFKLAANGSYGKSNSNDSFLYDPLYTMKTTISGQILISMWIERICEDIITEIIQCNTDGITIKVKRDDLDRVFEISNKLMEETKMEYEHAFYDKVVMRDVNNYSAKYDSGHIKHKGAFEINKELHKNPSMKIVPIALEKYFFEDIPIRDTIRNHNNIYDFCLRLKLNNPWGAELHTTDSDIRTNIQPLSKNTRYYISNSGGFLYKRHGLDNRLHGVSVGYLCTYFNKYIEKPIEEYDLNYQFYVDECNKIINMIEDKQLNLFGDDW